MAGPGYVRAGGGSEKGRIDDYFQDEHQTELGVKNRGGGKGVELKSLVAVRRSELSIPPFVGPIEIWTKVSSEALKLDAGGLIRIHKRRWLRKFDTGTSPPAEVELDSEEKPTNGRKLPDDGCNVEFTAVTVGPTGDKWWTLGFEAFGDLWKIESSLKGVAGALARRVPPPLTNGWLASYPAWLTAVLKHPPTLGQRPITDISPRAA